MKALLAALLVINVAFWAWTQGWLNAVVGVSPLGDREPARLARQLQPERVRVLRGAPRAAPAVDAPPPDPIAAAIPAPAVAQPAAPPAGEPGCLEAGPFTPAELVAAESALVRAAVPPGSWNELRVERPGAWIVYLGRFATREQLLQRQDELRRRQMPVEELRNSPDLEFGLSLGRFDDRIAAEAALAQATQRGVRNARVLTVVAPTIVHLLRVDSPDAALQALLAGLRVPALGAGFQRCGQQAAAR